jgi:2',3'-cyclic-nucleotide 2'-phosphodiesterase (5'-nucleotidase family)
MKMHNFRISRLVSPSIMLVGALVSLGALTVSPAQAGVSCHLINAKAVGQDLGGGSTTASVMGGGLLHGTNAGSLTITGVSGTVASFVETVTFTNRHGTLTVLVTGWIELTTGQFNASGPVTAATGKLAGATGQISLSGAANFATAIFSEDISGVVCVDLAP